MSVIARLFDSAEQARSASKALEAAKIPKRFIAFVETPSDDEVAAPVSAVDMVGASMKAGKLLGEHASFYLSHMQPGQHLIAVEAPLGLTIKAKTIMAEHGALDISHEPPEPAPTPYRASWNQAAPLSAALGWDVLSRSTETYSEFWGFPVLAKSRPTFLGRWFPALTRPGFALSSLLGLGLLSRNGAPLSSLLGLPVKSGRSGEAWTSSFGLPLLIRHNPAPLSSSLGLPLLVRKRWTY
jgi:hypothetical protein